MQQRKSTYGRPSGTDGSDFSYRMVVDSRYQKVAKGKKRLSVLFIIQCLLLVMGVVFAFLPAVEEDTLNIITVSSLVGGIISLIIAEIGRRRSRASFLRFYSVVSSVLALLLSASLAKRYSLLEVIQGLSFSETIKRNLNDFPVPLVGLLVYIPILLLFQIYTITAVVSVVGNMSPPRKAS
ncbi:hypothetical protein L6164_017536 [Bauhinia variegata]|uniref:Uncharacterized protein n=1 Tax=Bauhinia variegata TaxID=167791 RepID=A0ACB9NAB3_BAUVA|nr:hypothetical protein L6164_017536 [Bauhinia variegata]